MLEPPSCNKHPPLDPRGVAKKTNPGAADRRAEEADADPMCVPSHAVDIPRNAVRCDQYGCSLSHPGSRSAPVRGASAPADVSAFTRRPRSRGHPRPWDVHVHGDVQVHGTTTSTGRPRPRGHPRPWDVDVHGASASTGRPRPRGVHVHGHPRPRASTSVAVTDVNWSRRGRNLRNFMGKVYFFFLKKIYISYP